jgi:hypothetical protein
MAVIRSGPDTTELTIDTTFKSALVTVRPLGGGAAGTLVGHYRVNHRFAFAVTQAANSRVFEVKNNGGNLIVPTRLIIKVIQTGTFTAAIEDSLDVFKLTGFTAVDTTNTVTPTASVKRTAGMTAAPANAQIRGVTVAGAAAGMTGGTLTKDGGSVGQLPLWFTAAQPTGSEVVYTAVDNFDDVNGTHPFIFAQNEGFEIENRVLLGAAASASCYIDFSWAEVSVF